MKVEGMKVYVTRGSVHAGDDTDAPHAATFDFPEDADLKSVVADLAQRYLPTVIGGNSVWSVVSNTMVAIVAGRWREPRMFLAFESDLDRRDGILCLHFNYHAQEDPEAVWRIFWSFRTKGQ